MCPINRCWLICCSDCLFSSLNVKCNSKLFCFSRSWPNDFLRSSSFVFLCISFLRFFLLATTSRTSHSSFGCQFIDINSINGYNLNPSLDNPFIQANLLRMTPSPLFIVQRFIDTLWIPASRIFSIVQCHGIKTPYSFFLFPESFYPAPLFQNPCLLSSHSVNC